MIEVFLLAPLFLFAVLMTGFVRRMAVRAQLIAFPTSRSSHSVPTPIGGGIGIVLSYLAMLAFLALADIAPLGEIAVLLSGALVAVVGFLDDRKHLSVGLRLGVQTASVLYAVWLCGDLPPLWVGNMQVGGVLFAWVFIPLALVWLTNLYNFMDGIDGLAGMEAAFVSFAAAVILFAFGDVGLGLVCLGLFAGVTGFLVWNWPPARIFMGDAGSGFLGLTLGIVALLSHAHGTMSLWSWVLLLGAFIVDASVTLVRRIVTGKPFYQAHRQHAYQHAALRYKSHGVVTRTVLLLNILLLFPLAWLASRHPEHGVYFAAFGIVPLIVLVHCFGAGKESL